MKHLIATELRQQQTISPQMYQSLRVLQMNGMELEEYLREAVLENPVLEQDEAAYAAAQSLDSLREPALAWSGEEGGRKHGGEAPPRQLCAPDTGESLREYLVSQFDPDLDRSEVALLGAIVDFVDENGYLAAGDAEIARISGFPEEYVGYGVAYLQMLDPLGVCARGLAECLLIQLGRLGYRDGALRSIVENHLEDIASGRYGKIARGIGCSVQEARRLCGIVKSLHPKPGASFGGAIVPVGLPDVVVTVGNGAVTAAVEERPAGRVCISRYYERIARQDEYGEAAAYLKEKLAHARWLIKAVEGRRSTLQAIADLIADHQREFFLAAAGRLRPLTLREAAERLSLHESTVSRAIAGKHLQCRWGHFPLKHFFAARAGDSGSAQDTSRNAVKSRIRELISAEDPYSPLSDSRLAALLAAEGIGLSRRVIAKYRSEMCIPPTSARRRE